MSATAQDVASVDISRLSLLNVHALRAEPARPVPYKAAAWYQAALHVFRSEVADVDYPCHFGRRALNQGELFVTPAVVSDPAPLAQSLAAFLDYVRPTPRRRQVLAAFFNIEGTGPHRANGNIFWSVLQKLHNRDPSPWPAQMTQDTSDPAWEFCFYRTPMFVFSAAPTHRLRRSRNLGDALVMLLQPRNVFSGVEGGTPAGAAARRRIRAKLATWDISGLHPSMGDYGDPSNLEWRQYVIPDNAADMYDTCPFAPGGKPHTTDPGEC